MRSQRGWFAGRWRVLLVAAPLILLFVLARASDGVVSAAAWIVFFAAVGAAIVWGIVETVRGGSDFDDEDGVGGSAR